MPNDHGQLVSASPQDIATLPLNQAIEAYAPNFAAVLPANVSLEHFKRMVVTALNTNPDLAGADRRSLFNACIKCASDGLLPDGREAALVVFNTKIKKKVGNAWVEEWIKLAQFLPMIAGIRKRMRNSGEVASATAEVVCENDEFDYALGDNPFIHHKPAPFERSRGRAVGAYAIIKLRDGEILRDVMRYDEIEVARSKSRAKDSLMWTDFWGEGAKKTVLRRCSKAAPQSAVLESLLARDEELPEMPPHAELSAPEPEPPRGAAIAHQLEPEPGPSYEVLDLEGEIREYDNRADASEHLWRVLAQAERRGPDHLAAAREDNAALIAEIGEPQPNSPAGTRPQQPTKEDHTDGGHSAGALSGSAVGKLRSDTATNEPAGEEMPDLLGGKPRAATSYRVTLQDETAAGWEAWHSALTVRIESGDPPAAILRDNKDNIAIFEQIDTMKHNRLMRELGAK